MSSPRRISPRTAHRELGWDQALLVCAYDSADAFEQNHLEGALSLDDFQSRLSKLSKNQDIVFYCDCPEEKTASILAAKYQDLGFAGAMILEGGVKAWRDCGYKLIPPPQTLQSD